MANLKIKNLRFSYDELPVFLDLDFTLRKDKTLSIIGLSGSGKTTLLKLLNSELEYDGEISIDGKKICTSTIEDTKGIISVVFNDSSFLTDTVKEELKYSLEQINIDPKDIKQIVEELNDYFGINKLLNKHISLLSKNDKILLKILSCAITCPKYIAIDDMLSDLDIRTKILLLNYLNSKNILLINVTSDLEDVLYTDYVMCLYKGISGIDGKSLDVLKEEKILKRLGFSLPFMVDLSIQLKLYGLIDKVYLNKEAMVKNLWK
jgi:energy-coupling factor transporter ATP-binding protein EcfA2